MKTKHMYDYRSTLEKGLVRSVSVPSGERTMCGRDIYAVKWTYGYTNAGRRDPVTCKACLRIMKKK